MFISSRTGNKRDIGLSKTLSTPLLKSNDKFKVEEGESHKERTIMQRRRDEPGNVGGKLKNVLEAAVLMRLHLQVQSGFGECA